MGSSRREFGNTMWAPVAAILDRAAASSAVLTTHSGVGSSLNAGDPHIRYLTFAPLGALGVDPMRLCLSVHLTRHLVSHRPHTTRAAAVENVPRAHHTLLSCTTMRGAS